MTNKQARDEHARDYEKGIAVIIGGFGTGAALVYWVLPALVDLILYLGA